jgi:hypothetical protein
MRKTRKQKGNDMKTGERTEAVTAWMTAGDLWTTLLLGTLLLAGCAGRETASHPARDPGKNPFVISPARQGQSSSQRIASALQLAGEISARTGGTITVHLRDGTYFLDEPIVLRPEHSGIALVAYRGETPVLSGGRRITGWKEVNVDEKKLWAADIPEVREGRWYFRELWVNGERRPRARHPNRGHFKVEAVPDPTKTWSEGQNRFQFHAGDLRAWPTITNAEVISMSRWIDSHLPVTSVDETQRLVNFAKRTVAEFQVGDAYYLEGAFEALDAPGEWYLDAAGGRLFYWPLPGEKPGKIVAIAPRLVQVLRIEGQPPAGKFVENVTFRGLTFAHTEWNLPGVGEKNPPPGWPAPLTQVGGFAQAAIGVPGSVWGEGVRGCRFEDCTFTHLGNYALELARGAQSNRIARCEFSDLGGGGIKIGEQTIRTNAAEIAQRNEISDCRIHDGGKMFPAAVGLWIGQSPNNRAVHNLIHDFYYTGISVGWTWGYNPAALATNNLIEWNHVHHIGVKSDGDGPILSDMGGIYTLGRQPGTRILNNLWHDIAGIKYGGWGIYFDEGSSGILAENNLVYRTTHGGFHQHYGETNIVRNNIFAFARDHQIQRSREEPHISFSFSNNIVVFDQGVLLGGTWKNDQFIMDGNLYWDTRPATNPEQMKFAGATLDQWRARGHDRHSLIADPLFVAPKEGDFRLQDGSPARQIGFRPFNLNDVGPRP